MYGGLVERLVVVLKRRILKEIGTVFGSNLSTLIIGFLTGVIVARQIGAEGKGIVASLLVYPTMLTTLFQMGIRQAVVYEVGRGFFDERRVAGVVALLFLVSTALAISVCLLAYQVGGNSEFTLGMEVFAVATIPLTLINGYAGGFFLGKQRVDLLNHIKWLPALINLGLTSLLVWYFDLGVIGVLVSTLFSNLPVSLYAASRVIRLVGICLVFDLKIALNLLKLGFVYALALFLNSMNYRIDLLFLESMTSMRDVGLYSLGVNLSELVLQVPAAVGIVIFSHSANAKDAVKFSKGLQKGFLITLVACLIVGAAACIVTPLIVPIVYSDEFSESVSVIQLLMPGIIALCIYKLLGFDMAGKGKPWLAVMAAIPGLLINVGLNFLLIPRFGINGAAISSSFSYTTMAVCYFLIYRRVIKKMALQ